MLGLLEVGCGEFCFDKVSTQIVLTFVSFYSFQLNYHTRVSLSEKLRKKAVGCGIIVSPPMENLEVGDCND